MWVTQTSFSRQSDYSQIARLSEFWKSTGTIPKTGGFQGKLGVTGFAFKNWGRPGQTGPLDTYVGEGSLPLRVNIVDIYEDLWKPSIESISFILIRQVVNLSDLFRAIILLTWLPLMWFIAWSSPCIYILFKYIQLNNIDDGQVRLPEWFWQDIWFRLANGSVSIS